MPPPADLYVTSQVHFARRTASVAAVQVCPAVTSTSDQGHARVGVTSHIRLARRPVRVIHRKHRITADSCRRVPRECRLAANTISSRPEKIASSFFCKIIISRSFNFATSFTAKPPPQYRRRRILSSANRLRRRQISSAQLA